MPRWRGGSLHREWQRMREPPVRAVRRRLPSYLWDRELWVAFLLDLAIIEVALRNAMAEQLERRWGSQWYRNTELPLDDRSLNALNQAWKRISGTRTPEKMVAH